MTKMELNKRSLPEPLLRLSNQPLRGIAADSGLTVEKLYSMTHDSKEMNNKHNRFEWIR